MKIRNGFVSNSSSSSFMIYGVELSELDVQKLVGNVADVDEDGYVLDEGDARYTVEEKLSEKLKSVGLKYTRDWESQIFYIGLDVWNGLGEDETKNQFKTRVGERVEKLLGKPTEVSLHEGTIYS